MLALTASSPFAPAKCNDFKEGDEEGNSDARSLCGGSSWRLARIGRTDIDSRAHLISMLTAIRSTPASCTSDKFQQFIELIFVRVVPRAILDEEFESAVRTFKPDDVLYCLSPRAQRPVPCVITRAPTGPSQKVIVRYNATGEQREVDRSNVLIEGEWGPYGDYQIFNQSLLVDAAQRVNLAPGRVRLGDDVCFGQLNWLRTERGRVVRVTSDENWEADVIVEPHGSSPPWVETRRNLSCSQLADELQQGDLAVAAPTAGWRQGKTNKVHDLRADLVVRGPWCAWHRCMRGDTFRMEQSASSNNKRDLGSRRFRPCSIDRVAGDDSFFLKWDDDDAGDLVIAFERHAFHPRFRAPEVLLRRPASDDAQGWASREPARNPDRDTSATSLLGLHLVLNEDDWSEFGPIQICVIEPPASSSAAPSLFPCRIMFVNAHVPDQWVRIEPVIDDKRNDTPCLAHTRCNLWRVHLEKTGDNDALAQLMGLDSSQDSSQIVLARETTFFLPHDEDAPVYFKAPKQYSDTVDTGLIDSLWQLYSDEAEIEFNFDGEWGVPLSSTESGDQGLPSVDKEQVFAQPIAQARLTQKKRPDEKGFDTLLRFHNIDVQDLYVKVERYAKSDEGDGFDGCVTIPVTKEREQVPSATVKCKFRIAQLGVAYFELSGTSGYSGFLSSLDTTHPQARSETHTRAPARARMWTREPSLPALYCFVGPCCVRSRAMES